MSKNRPTKFYHGTSVDAAIAIQQNGFDLSFCGRNAGCLLGPGVYCSTMLRKAMTYADMARCQYNCGGVVLELEIDLGKCIVLQGDDKVSQNSYQQHGSNREPA